MRLDAALSENSRGTLGVELTLPTAAKTVRPRWRSPT